MFIKYSGEFVSKSKVQVPGFAGDSASESFQFWTHKQFTDFATSGIELNYPYDDIIVPDVVAPFKKVSDLFYSLEIELVLKTPDKYASLVLPHYRFYTDLNWETPIPVAAMIDTDWWPNHLNVIFRLPPCKSIFRKGEPFAQVIIVPRNALRIEKMSDKEIEGNEKSQVYIRNAKNLATREWVTSSGYVQNNLYEVLSHLEHQNKLPIKTKKFKIIT